MNAGGGEGKKQRKKNIPKRGAAYLFEEGHADEDITESEDEPSDVEREPVPEPASDRQHRAAPGEFQNLGLLFWPPSTMILCLV